MLQQLLKCLAKYLLPFTLYGFLHIKLTNFYVFFVEFYLIGQHKVVSYCEAEENTCHMTFYSLQRRLKNPAKSRGFGQWE